MYLKSIKAHGFKSFADVVELDIKKGITGVVGPNGSGKSNIVDAVKWVLGEQSVKALRGTNQMTDVIFSGSKTRNMMNRAYVALTFDNTDKYLNTTFDNVEIKRVLYKNGENEYFINNNKVRLKDITDLFIDSGAGKESFNIISQGSVGDVINSKPEDRRVIIESAAGVLKYKKRKEETNRKLLKVNDNLEKINLIIEELEKNLNPLKKQADDATKYKNYKHELENIEIAIMAKDITDLNEQYQELKNLVDTLNEDAVSFNATVNEKSALLENIRLQSIKIDEKITELNEKIIKLTQEISKLNSQKQLTIERKKYEVDSNVLANNIINLKEEELTLQNNISSLKKDIEILNESFDEKIKIFNEQKSKYQKATLEKSALNKDIEEKNKQQLYYRNQINIIENNIENDSSLPYSVKSILNNTRFSKVHNTIGKLINIDDKYVNAIDTVLGYSANIIVVDDQLCAKECIEYLKENKLGRATFFPLNVIKGKFIDQETIAKVKNVHGYIGIASSLVNYDKKYENIIQNQLGNVLVVEDIDALNNVGKIINYKYRVVSLDKEILHTGGALTGGASKTVSNSALALKDQLNNLQKQAALNDKKLAELNKQSDEKTLHINDIIEKISKYNYELSSLKEDINRKSITLKDLEERYEIKHEELLGAQNVKDNSLDKELNDILENYYQKNQEKGILEKELASYKNQKDDIFFKINEIEKENKDKNTKYNKKIQELKEAEIKLGKVDVKLDTLLNSLSETYNLTYEKARANYHLDMAEDLARNSIIDLKRKIQSLGNVNLGAIEEFERINTRYTFLDSQKQDLVCSVESLNTAIKEMDEIMKNKFLETFEIVNKEFNTVYKQLFKGGDGRLKLTDPDNLLETGIEIIAQPPGKKMNSIGLLSGGEKTLTAISLLFAILNVKPVPFVILDEVEAALDDANVETFGTYLLEKKEKSQFIIITHKKKTMEYADVLYGITMQESGVSKLVSVKLENI